MKDYALKVIGTKQESEGIKSAYFSTEGTDISYKAGQYAMLSFHDIIDEDKGNMRPFTLSSSPTEKGHITITTRISDTKVKQRFNELKQGDEVALKLALGRFTLDEDSSLPIVMIAGGIGITPFRSHIKYATDMKLPHKITLIYASRTAEELVFKNEFDTLLNDNPNLQVMYTVTQPKESEHWTGRFGRIDEGMLKEAAPDLEKTRFYICGPPVMVDAIIALLKEIGAKPELIKVEKFVGY